MSVSRTTNFSPDPTAKYKFLAERLNVNFEKSTFGRDSFSLLVVTAESI